MPQRSSITYAIVLTFLLGLFFLRCLAQLLQWLYPLDWLPAFEKWQSGAVPYSALLISQLLILAVGGVVIIRLWQQRIIPSLNWGRGLRILGGFYLVGTMLRVGIGTMQLSNNPWFQAHLPSLFHVILALWILVLSDYHLRTIKRLAPSIKA